MITEIILVIFILCYYLFSLGFLISCVNEEVLYSRLIICRILIRILIIVIAPIAVPFILGVILNNRLKD